MRELIAARVAAPRAPVAPGAGSSALQVTEDEPLGDEDPGTGNPDRWPASYEEYRPVPIVQLVSRMGGTRTAASDPRGLSVGPGVE